MNILMISGLNIWSIGNNIGARSMFETLRGLSRHAHVHLITNYSGYRGNLELKNTTFHTFSLSWLESTFQKDNIGYKLRFLVFPLWWILFQICSCFLAISLLLKNKFSVIYAYEVIGVLSAKFLSLLFKLPLITRFQGTVIPPKNQYRIFSIAKQFHHFLALKTKADAIIMANDGTQGDKVLQSLKNNSTVYFWMNGIRMPSVGSAFDMDKLRIRLNISAQEKVLLTVSRLVRWKRVDRAINAFDALGNENVHLIIVGDGDEKIRLQSLARQKKYFNHIHFEGGIPQQKLGVYYKIADVFLSLYDLSNVGNPLLEAMRFGKAIVTLDNGDTKKIIRNEETGVLLNQPHSEIIAAAIRELLANDEKRDKLSINAKLYAEKNFLTWDMRMDKEWLVISRLTD